MSTVSKPLAYFISHFVFLTLIYVTGQAHDTLQEHISSPVSADLLFFTFSQNASEDRHFKMPLSHKPVIATLSMYINLHSNTKSLN